MRIMSRENAEPTARPGRKHIFLERLIAVFHFVGPLVTMVVIGLLVNDSFGCIIIAFGWSLALIIFPVEVMCSSRIWRLDDDEVIDPGDLTEAEVIVTTQIVSSFLILVTGFFLVFRIAGSLD